MSELPNWIKIHSDHRISYYPSGDKSIGERKQIRGGKSALTANKRAREIVREITIGKSLAISIDATWTTLLTAWEVDHVSTMKEGTYRRRMSGINAHILPAIGDIRIAATDELTLITLLDHVTDSGSGLSNFNSVLQTLNVIKNWAVTRKYLAEDCFGSPSSVKTAIKLSREKSKTKKASNDEGDDDYGIKLKDCPTWDDVLNLANEVANIYSARTSDAQLGKLYGAAVRLCAGTGLRLSELLGVDASRVDFKRGVINIDRQIDRYAPWLPGQPMPTVQTKNATTRDARVWEKVRDDLKLLLDAAGPDGPLVPPSNDITWWADAWGRALSLAAARAGWTWKPHYLRHHYGSYSIADPLNGGMGMHYTKVQKSMGHKSPEVTLRVYVHPIEGEDEGWIS